MSSMKSVSLRGCSAKRIEAGLNAIAASTTSFRQRRTTIAHVSSYAAQLSRMATEATPPNAPAKSESTWTKKARRKLITQEEDRRQPSRRRASWRL
jgi:hypothetical protein